MAENVTETDLIEENAEMEVANENSSSESDSEFSDSDVDERLERRLLTLEEKLQESPFMYDLHVEKIQLLRQSGELEKLREARETMNNIFPLSEELWLAWLEDETKVSEGTSDRKIISDLFDRAVNDYLSVSVWLEYVQYAIGGMSEADGIQSIRNVFERAISSVGLHVTKGAMIWDAYREFENAIFMGLQPAPGTILSPDQQSQLTTQQNKVNNLFRRQLAVPLQDMKGTYEEFLEWNTDKVDAYIEQVYRKSLEKMEKLDEFEDKLLQSDPPHLEAYYEYIEYEITQGEPTRIQCIYERAIQENCLVSDLWLRYAKYLDTNLKVKDVIIKVYERSVRNCPWCSDLWLGYVRAMERHGAEHNSILEVIERALSAGFNQAEDYLRMWTGYCDYLRRRIKWNEDHEYELEQLRTTLDRAITLLDQNFGKDGDPNCTLLQYYARLEAIHCENMAKCRELWSQILQKGLGTQCAFWMEYLNLERSFGDSKHCRKLLLRALNSVTDFPEVISDTCINYEREEGTLQQFDQMVTKCTAQLQRIEERKSKATEKETLLNEQHKARQDGRKANKKSEKKSKHHKDGLPVPQKRHSEYIPKKTLQSVHLVNESPMVSSADPSEQPPLEALQELADGSLPGSGQKRKRESTSATTSDGVDADGFKVPAPPGYKPKVPKLDSTKSQPPPGFKPRSMSKSSEQPSPGNKNRSQPPPGYKHKSQPPPGYKDKSHPPPGYKDNTKTHSKNSDQELLEKCFQEIKEDGEEHEIMDTTEASPAASSSNNQCTVFVSNLAYDIDEEKLKHIFSKAGEIKEVRLIRNAKAKSRGFAYVQFLDEFPVKEALAMDRNQLEGRPMFVSPCEEKSTRTQKFKYSTGLEKNKLFVSGLPFTTSKEALETIFSQYGKLSMVRLVTYRSGAPKGLAFVEFENEHDAAQAVLKADGLQIGEHTISVAISNPPERKTPAHQKETQMFTPSLGGGKRETIGRGKARTQLPLLPRSLKRPPTSAEPGNTSQRDTEKIEKQSNETGEDNGTSSASTEKTGKLCNADFRNMLLGGKR